MVVARSWGQCKSLDCYSVGHSLCFDQQAYFTRCALCEMTSPSVATFALHEELPMTSETNREAAIEPCDPSRLAALDNSVTAGLRNK